MKILGRRSCSNATGAEGIAMLVSLVARQDWRALSCSRCLALPVNTMHLRITNRLA